MWVYEEHINIYEGKGQKIGFDVNMQDIEVHKWNMLSMKNAKKLWIPDRFTKR